MNNEIFNQKMLDFQKEIDKLPPKKQAMLADMVNETKARNTQIEKNSAILENALHDIRVHSAYQRFDVEATRRENKSLRDQLDQQNRDNEQE